MEAGAGVVKPNDQIVEAEKTREAGSVKRKMEKCESTSDSTQ